MDIGVTAIRRWMVQYEAERQGQLGSAPLTTEPQRTRQLQQENYQLRSNLDVVKKASAFFSLEFKRAIYSSMSCKRGPYVWQKSATCWARVGPDSTKSGTVLRRPFL